jgi:hypothetical protein
MGDASSSRLACPGPKLVPKPNFLMPGSCLRAVTSPCTLFPYADVPALQ